MNYKNWNTWYTLPVYICIALIPLIMGRRIVEKTKVERFVEIFGNDLNYDYFNKAKAEVLIYFSVIILVTIFVLFINKKLVLGRRWYVLVAVIYGALVAISYVLSRYKKVVDEFYSVYLNEDLMHNILDNQNIGLLGFSDMYEGVFVLISYIVIFMGVLLLLKSTKSIKKLVYILIGTGLIVSIIAIFQYFGYDFLQSGVGLRLIVGEGFNQVKENLGFRFSSYYSVGTLYNPNYLGGYTAMVLLLAVGMFFSESRGEVNIGLYLIVVVMFMSLLASNSSTGIISFVVAFAVYLILTFGLMHGYWKKLLLLAVSSVVVVLLMNYSSDGRVSKEANSISGNLKIIEGNQLSTKNLFTSIKKVKSGITIETEENDLTIAILEGDLKFYDTQNQALTLYREEGALRISDPDYSMYIIEMLEDGFLELDIGGPKLVVYMSGSDIKVLGPGMITELYNAEISSFGFEGREKFASNRGYIWSRSLPLLKNNIMLGVGPDAFGVVYPQYDVIGKANFLAGSHQVVTKPHNLYIQMAINTGLVSLLLFLSLLLGAIISGLKISKKSFVNESQTVVISLVCALIAFGIASLSNDSTISVTFIAWVMMGMLYSLNEESKIFKGKIVL